jgi:hypothetical protein
MANERERSKARCQPNCMSLWQNASHPTPCADKKKADQAGREFHSLYLAVTTFFSPPIKIHLPAKLTAASGEL